MASIREDFDEVSSSTNFSTQSLKKLRSTKYFEEVLFPVCYSFYVCKGIAYFYSRELSFWKPFFVI